MSYLNYQHGRLHHHSQPEHGLVGYQQYTVVERPVEDYCGGGGGYRTENTAIMTDYISTPPGHHHHGQAQAVYKHKETYEGAGYYGGGGHSNHLGRIQNNCEEDVVEDVEVIKRKQYIY